MITAKITGINKPQNFIWSDKESKFVFPASIAYIEVTDCTHRVVCFAHNITTDKELNKIMADNFYLQAYMNGYKVTKLEREDFKITEFKNNTTNNELFFNSTIVPKYGSLFEFRGKLAGGDIEIGELKIGLSERFLMGDEFKDGDFISFESSYISLGVNKKINKKS